MLINIFFLGIVKAHQRFTRLDHPLRVPDKVAVDVLRPHGIGKSGEQPGEMHDLAVSAAHRGEAVAVMQDLGQTRVDRGFVVALMPHDLVGDERVRFADERACFLGAGVVEGVGDAAQAVEGFLQDFVALVQVTGGGRRQGCRGA